MVVSFHPKIPSLSDSNHTPPFMAAARPIRCELRPHITVRQRGAPPQPPVTTLQRPKVTVDPENGKILLQPRLCTLRSFGSNRTAVLKTRKDGGDAVSPFFETLSVYIETQKNSHDFEIITGRFAMIVFAVMVGTEVVTGNSVFRKMDVEGLTEGLGACLAAVSCAAGFAWLSSARNKVGRIFTVRCNAFIDSLIDQIVDGLFYDSELSDWNDDI